MIENENIILTIREINIPINNNVSTTPLNNNEILYVTATPSIEIPTLFKPRMIIRIPMKMMMTIKK